MTSSVVSRRGIGPAKSVLHLKASPATTPMWIHRYSPRAIALITALDVLLSPLAPLVHAQATSPTATPQPASPPTSEAGDGGWPRDFVTATGGMVRVFQPQIASWDGQKRIVMYAGVSYSAKGSEKPALGTIKVEGNTSVSVSERLVNFTDFRMTESNFPGLASDKQKEIVSELTAEMAKKVPEGETVLGLDRVLARLDKSELIPKNIDGVKADPPEIFYSSAPAVLMNLDGDPVWSPIKENDLKFAVNTNWDLFEHTPTKTLYLRRDDSWLTATELTGPWKPAGKLPDSFAKLPPEENWKDVKAALPGRALSAASTPKGLVSTKPAELILVHGAPSYLLVDGTRLLWVSNTDADVFRLGKGGPVYYLVSGRWFSAPDFTGPWTFATTTLAED